VRTIEVLIPVPPDADERGSETFDLARPVRGVHIGLRLDPAWRSYYKVVDEWTRLFEAAGAEIHVLVAGERVGPTAAQARADIDDWARLIEVGVIGLGN
jgi:hypothetical protein